MNRFLLIFGLLILTACGGEKATEVSEECKALTKVYSVWQSFGSCWEKRLDIDSEGAQEHFRKCFDDLRKNHKGIAPEMLAKIPYFNHMYHNHKALYIIEEKVQKIEDKMQSCIKLESKTSGKEGFILTTKCLKELLNEIYQEYKSQFQCS